MLLQNKVVFLTGGSGGIGTACARAVLEEGAQLILTDIDEQKATKLTNALKDEFGKDRVIFIKCDVSDAENFKDAFKEGVKVFGNIDIMVNNAGILEEIEWKKTLDVNLRGVIVGTELANGHMRKDKGGRGGVIINMSSIAGFTPFCIAPTYVASKHAVIGYTRSLASAPDLGIQSIKYACICPSFVDTELVDSLAQKCREEYKHLVKGIVPAEKAPPRLVGEGLLSLLKDDDSNDTLLEVSLQQGLVRKKLTMEIL